MAGKKREVKAISKKHLAPSDNNTKPKGRKHRSSSMMSASNDNLEESKHMASGSQHSGEDEMEENEEEAVNKFGFQQLVTLEMRLPTEDIEVITDYKMNFVDRNAMGKNSDELNEEE